MKEGWTYKKLGEVCEIFGRIGFRGYTKNDLVNSPEAGAITLSPSNIIDGEMNYGKCSYITWAKYEESPEIKIYPGDILLVKTASVGKTALVKYLPHKATINPQFVVLKKISINNEYLSYYLKSEKAQNFIWSIAKGAAAQTVSQKNLAEMMVPNPALSEQQRVVSRLDAAFSHIDELKAKAEKQLSEARALFQKSLAKAMEPKEGWKEETLKEVCSVITDGTHHSPTNLPKGRYKYITAKNIKPWGLDLSNITYVSEDVHREIIARCNPQKGDVLYIKDGATTGIAIINPLDEEISILSSVALIRPQKNILLSKYLCYALNSPSIYEQTRNQMDGAAITRVTLVKIKGFSIPLPPLSEQQRIVERLDALSAHVRELEENQKKIISECDALKQALLRKVFE